MTEPLPPEPEVRSGPLRLALQAAGLPGDAPWSQAVAALRSAGYEDVLYPEPTPSATPTPPTAPTPTDSTAASPTPTPTPAPAPAASASATAPADAPKPPSRSEGLPFLPCPACGAHLRIEEAP